MVPLNNNSAQIRPINSAPQMRAMPVQGSAIPKSVPSPSDAIAPEVEAVVENEVAQSFSTPQAPAFEPDAVPENPCAQVSVPENAAIGMRASEKNVGGLTDPFNYENDLDEGGKRDFVKPLIESLKEKLAQATLSANDVAKCLNVSHTRITRNYPNGTKLSEILANLPKPRTIDPDKLVGRLSESAKRELLAKLQQELG
ncbi:MAG: hypothetical protein IKU22_09230 [Alistipes sp.]|nr:hypothetical protein [Alistipes sp.]